MAVAILRIPSELLFTAIATITRSLLITVAGVEAVLDEAMMNS